MRDRSAERALVEALLEVDAVVAFTALARGGPGEAADPAGPAARASTRSADLLPALEEVPDLEVTVAGEPAQYSEAVDAPLIQVSTSDTGDGGSTDWFDSASR